MGLPGLIPDQHWHWERQVWHVTTRKFLHLLVLLFALALLPALSLAGAQPPTIPVVGQKTASALVFANGDWAMAEASAVPTVDVDVPILMYHYLTDAEPLPSVYYVTQDTFEKQMAALIAYGYQTISLQDFMDYRSGLATPPARAVILTLDDGHKSVHTYARPVLNDKDMKATVFLTTGFVQETDLGWDWMAWGPHVDTLYSEGFDIEAHSLTHPILTQVSEEQAWQEISESRLEIESRLGNQVRFFSYPGGYYDADIQGLVQQAGYRAAVAAWPDGIANTATSNIWALPRIEIHETHSVELDPARPDDFFMRKVDPGFPIPDITVDSVQVRLADDTPDSCFSPGETITFAVTATNHGDTVATQAALYLDDDADHADSYYHGVTSEHLANSESKRFQFALTLPDNVDLGHHDYAVDFDDEYGVLGFKHSGWQAAFEVAATCPRPEIVVDPMRLTFGSQDVDGGATLSQTVTFANVGTADLRISSVNLVGADAPAFLLVSDTGEDTLTPGVMRIIQIAFDPVRIGACSAELRIQSDDGNENTVDVVLSGTGTIGLDSKTYLPQIAQRK
jgi:peptidoglycan/xylan/chitin deacetylase (PgdA/CDA1 family)